MKKLIAKICVAVLVAGVLSGCGSIRQESAMEWMERQPWSSDGPN